MKTHRQLSHRRLGAALIASAALGALPVITPASATAPPGSAPVDSDDPTMGLGQEVLDAAQEEGGPVVHIGSMADGTFEELSAAFEERFDVPVELIRTGGGEGSERVRTELRADDLTIDTVGFGGFYPELLAQDDLLAEFLPPGADDFMLVDVDPNGHWLPFAENLYGIAVNTSRVDEENVPQSWRDLVTFDQPLLMFDPATGSAGFQFYADFLTNPDFGEEFLRELGQNENLQFGAQAVDNGVQLARGEVDAYFPFSTQELVTLADAPVELVLPEEGPMLTAINAGVLADAPHPNGARLWLTFLLSEEGQTIVAAGSQVPVRAEVPPLNPDYDLATLEPFPPLAEMDKYELLGPVQDGAARELGLGS